jgi:hypothetical protein
MKNKKKLLGMIFIIALVIWAFYLGGISNKDLNLAPGEVDYLGHHLITSYAAGDKIKGSVNLSLSEYPAEVLLTSNLPGNITVLDFLAANDLSSGDEYNCSSSSCLPDYESQEEITSLSVNDDGVIAGFSITGADVFTINSVKLRIDSDAGPTCFFPQLFVDVLNNEDELIINNKKSGQICLATYKGCFNPGDSDGEAVISQNFKYCENITLPAAPGFELGARVKNSTMGSGKLKMILYRANDIGESIRDCILPKHKLNGFENLKCPVNYSSPEQDQYFVCITSPDSGPNYKIKFDNKDVCGTNSNNFGSPVADYEIFSKAMEFDSVENLEIDESFFETYNFELTNYVQEYISEVYSGNCQPSCSIPLRFIGQDQLLQFNNIQIQYSSQLGLIENNNFYNLEIEPVTVTSGELELDLEKAGFTIPLDSEEEEFVLYMDGEIIFDESIEIAESFAFDVNPKFVPFGQNTLFRAETNKSITSSTWDFDDGTVENVNGKESSHRYLQEGDFSLEVSLVNVDGLLSTRTFTITVGDAKEIANLTIIDYRNRLITLRDNINSFPNWIKTELDEQIDLVDLEESLKGIEELYTNASSDEEFQEVMLALIDLRVPKEIKVTQIGEAVPLLVGFDNVDTSYIEEISSKTVDDAAELKSNIALWSNENFNAKISFEKISGVYDDETEIILSKFKIETNPKKTVEDVSYLIVGLNVEADGKFMTDYGQAALSGGDYITLSSGAANKVFEFYVLGEFEPEEVGAYISPSISQLGDFDDSISPCNFNGLCEEGIGEDKNNCAADCSAGRWPWFIIWIVILLFVALVVYITLQEWYKKHYEKSLFKSENELYNLINFIYNARKAGLTNRDVRKKLKEVGWKGEKIIYAPKKMDGKRTGLYEIPLFKFIENKKVKKELTRRQQGGPIDRRFIKRPGF